MKKFFRILAIIILLIIVVIVVAGLVAEKDIRVERTTTINAPKEVVFEQMVKYRNWQNWLPWAKQDKTMIVEYSATDGQLGSEYSFKSKKFGDGKMTTTSVNGTEMKFDMEFNGWDKKSRGTLRAEDAGSGQTKAVWVMEQRMDFPMNAFGFFMKGMLEKDFDKGLADMKAFVESGKTAMPSASGNELGPIQETTFPAHTYAVVRKTVGWNDMEQYYKSTYEMISKEAGQRINGPASSLIYKWDEANHNADLAAGFPLTDATPVKGATIVDVPATKAYMLVYKGGYSGFTDAHMAMGKHLAKNGATPTLTIEEYIVSDYKTKDSTQWVTNIYYLVK